MFNHLSLQGQSSNVLHGLLASPRAFQAFWEATAIFRVLPVLPGVDLQGSSCWCLSPNRGSGINGTGSRARAKKEPVLFVNVLDEAVRSIWHNPISPFECMSLKHPKHCSCLRKSTSFGMVLKKNTHNYRKSLLSDSSLFQLCLCKARIYSYVYFNQLTYYCTKFL